METSKTTPRFSVLTPVYNGGRYLAAAIESVLSQRMRDFEYVLIDDGSKDDSAAIIAHYAARDDRIVFRSRPNKGVSATRNELVAMAQAPLIAWMDADDLALPAWLNDMGAWMDQHPPVVAAGCFVEMMDAQGMPICKWTCATTHDEIDAGHLREGQKSVLCGSSVMRRAAILEAGGFDELLRGGEDLDLLLKLGEHGRIACMPEVLYKYRQHLASMCQSMKDEIWTDVRQVLMNARARRGLPMQEPSHTRNSSRPAEIHRRWAWWALADHNVSTARKHAHRALLLDPFSRATWQTVACAWRGR